MDLRKIVRAALRGSQKLEITFDPKYVDEVQYVCGMAHRKIIKIDAADFKTLTNIVQTKNWGKDSNRTLTIELTPTFDIDWFLGRLEGVLENAQAI